MTTCRAPSSIPRALADNGYPNRLSAEQIGQAWLNYIVEERSVLWWGGIGNRPNTPPICDSKSGIPAPQSGSIASMEKRAEQIGAQIFIDGWPWSARQSRAGGVSGQQAGSVSHDGESVHAAKLLAAMKRKPLSRTTSENCCTVGLGFVAEGIP